jgi:hypothetical protein
MEELMGNDDKRRAMGLEARKIVSRYSLESVLHQWDDLFRNVGLAD